MGKLLLLLCAMSAVCGVEKVQPWLTKHAQGKTSVEFFVLMTPRADLSNAGSFSSKVEKGHFVRDTLRATAKQSQLSLQQFLRSHNITFQSFFLVNGLLITDGTPELMHLIAAREDVLRLEGNPLIKLEAPLNVTEAYGSNPNAIEPGLTFIGAPNVWGEGFEGQGVVIAGMDTGIAWDVPALKTKYRGFNVQSGQVDHSYSWHDAVHSGGGRCGFNTLAPCDDNAHGTHTVGTVLGSDGANAIGVAPQAKFIGCRNMNAGLGSPATYLECMEWALAPYPPGSTPDQGSVEHAPDITTNSWGCPSSEGCSPTTLHQAVEATRAAGILMVAAAGNSGSGCSTVSDTPSFEANVYTVGAVSSSSGTLASFSSRGPAPDGRVKPEISAPGVGVRSCVPGGGYQSMSGTSMACPHVAGAVALLWSSMPSLRNRLTETTDLLNSAAKAVSSIACSSSESVPNNLYGFGTLSIDNTVALARASVAPLAVQIQEDGGAASVRVTDIDSGLMWKASSLDTWLTVSTRGGTGVGAVEITASRAPAPRVGTVVIAGQRVQVSQRDEHKVSTV
jgi:subtilisin family serine protease